MGKKKNKNQNLPAKKPSKFRKFLAALGLIGVGTIAATQFQEKEAEEPNKIERTEDKEKPEVNEKQKVEASVKDFRELLLKIDRNAQKEQEIDAEQIADQAIADATNTIDEKAEEKRIAAEKTPEIVTGENGVTEAEYNPDTSIEEINSSGTFDMEVEEPTTENNGQNQDQSQDQNKEQEKPTETIKVESVESLEEQIPDSDSDIKVGMEITADQEDIESGEVKYNPDEEKIEIGPNVDEVEEKVVLDNDNENGGYEVGDNEEEAIEIEVSDPFLTSLEEQVNSYEDSWVDQEGEEETKQHSENEKEQKTQEKQDKDEEVR